ncbi:hypothetical protein SAMN04515691_0785 [Leifsonia sp. 98AMF]|uniref:MAE_28990/MAE_18760 family HEPN-like nuclease n=1 Tax=unclassified Leifsonia TaxID=2663824 RepID=UPI00087BF740|nr:MULTISPECIES: MAE_28990/MAE_18760 family HEPN-like nuclease [unclassified Leifsonia]SDH59805.1 hypothetical protein SAMN04515690_3235 [Leifsonia sp. 197AMF]SDI79294.1 hypothetical protein SAMN04515684_0553 [Leifsonia sp. 466MF]SDK06369.1 hypothetical protein SAMN04515683_2196 [Leifsonia sp. 157MF]SDN82838.1 hypothetical protein SAMN04515686_2755 [Leifsonia sp. 509MF]SEN24416.1 hypothetical protein SAMN04515685_2181 [Leifsonia sp. 467MF]
MALDVFKDGAIEVGLLRQMAVEAESRGSIEEANALCRAAVVLLVSHFESFLKTIAEEYVDAIESGEVPSGRIPRGLREAHTLPRLQAIVTSGNDEQRSVLLKRLGNDAALWKEDAKPPKGSLNAGTFSRLVTSAKADVINDVFVRMGSKSNVCDGDIEMASSGGDVITANIQLSIRDVIACRNDIAHGKAERKPTPDDVTRYLQFLQAFSTRLQRKATMLSVELLEVM